MAIVVSTECFRVSTLICLDQINSWSPASQQKHPPATKLSIAMMMLKMMNPMSSMPVMIEFIYLPI